MSALHCPDRQLDDAIVFEAQSSTRRQRGEDVSGLEAVHLGGEHIRPSTSATSPRSAAHLGQRMD